MNRPPVTPELSAVPSLALEQRLDGPQILIVDDEDVVGDICSRALTNCRVTRAGGGNQALDLIAKTDFDLILTDVNMPDIGGLELLRTIKESQPNQSVIVMTGYACKDTILEALKADADDFISKPPNKVELLTRVKSLINVKMLNNNLTGIENVLFSSIILDPLPII